MLFRSVASVDRLVPQELRASWTQLAAFTGLRNNMDWPSNHDAASWKALAELVLTKGGDWRKQLTARNGFGPGRERQKRECQDLIGALSHVRGLDEALASLQKLPAISFGDAQWDVMQALFDCLKLAVAELKLVFAEEGTIDFCEIGIAARQALGDDDHPTDLAFRLHGRIEHLLIDEIGRAHV